MYQPEIKLEAQRPPPGVRCPTCRRSEMLLGPDSQNRASLTCALCGAFVRLLQRRGDPEPGFEPRPGGTSEYAFDAPSSDSWWIGLIRQRDEVWRAVALTKTHGGCWDSLLTYPGEGDRLTVPADPPTWPAAQQDQAMAPAGVAA
jgi:hypothetical protein